MPPALAPPRGLALPHATGAPPLIGRAVALGKLRADWALASQGRRQILWIAGEAGVGKTTLIDGLIAELGNAACAHGQCVEQFGAGEPYLPVLDALNSLCRQDASLPALMRQIAPTWLLQLPWLIGEAERSSLQAELAGANQDRMLREMGELLDRYTQQRPLLLVTEDLHWSDHATVRLIDHVARRRTPGALMWLGSFRLAELVAEEHPLKGVRQELRAHRLCHEILLEPFSQQDVADYLAQRLPGTTVPEDFVRGLHAHTDGLPLFVANVLDDLLAQQAGPTGAAAIGGTADSIDLGHWGTHWSVPDSLLGVIDKQIERLPPDLAELLGAGSVCGMEFRPETVAAVIGHEPAWVHESCERLARRLNWLESLGVSRRADGGLDAPYAFRHALYRHVFYRRLGAARRADLHRRVGRALQAEREAGVSVAAAALALHFEEGHELTFALRFHAEAAANAMNHFAPLEAARHAERGLGLLPQLPEGPARLELELPLITLRGVASAQLHGVASPEAVASLQRARELWEQLPSTPERAWVMSGVGWIYYVRGEFAAALDMGQRIHAQAEASGDRVLYIAACNLLGCVLCNSGEQADALRWHERGLMACATMQLKRPLGGFMVDPEVSMHANASQPLVHMGLAAEARRHAQAALALSAVVAQPFARMLARWCACMVEIHFDDPVRALALAEELDEIVRTHGVVHGEGPSLWNRGWAQARLGRPREGLAMILEGYERHARFGMYCGCPKILCYAAQAALWLGDSTVAARHLDAALALAARIGETLDVPSMLLLRAQLEDARGASAAARASLQDGLAKARAVGAQGAALELATALCARDDAMPGELAELRDACTRLPEGFDIALRERALAVLADRAA